jgi:hypothetical protein
MQFRWLAAAAAMVALTGQAESARLVTTFDYDGLSGNDLEGGVRFDPTLGKLTSVNLRFDVRSEYFLSGYSFADDDTPIPTTVNFSEDNVTGVSFGDIGFNVDVKVAKPSVTFSGDAGSGRIAFFAYGAVNFTTDAVTPFIISPNRPEARQLITTSNRGGTFTVEGPGFVDWDAVGNQVRGTASYTYTPFTAVPEPASWAMMISGFGLIGGAMRQRKVNTTVCLA